MSALHYPTNHISKHWPQRGNRKKQQQFYKHRRQRQNNSKRSIWITNTAQTQPLTEGNKKERIDTLKERKRKDPVQLYHSGVRGAPMTSHSWQMPRCCLSTVLQSQYTVETHTQAGQCKTKRNTHTQDVHRHNKRVHTHTHGPLQRKTLKHTHAQACKDWFHNETTKCSVHQKTHVKVDHCCASPLLAILRYGMHPHRVKSSALYR